MSADSTAMNAIADYEPDIREALEQLHGLIIQVAKEEDVGPIEETLKWGQPSFLTPKSKAGTTVRIDRDLSHEGRVALYVHCQTNLVESWRERFSDFKFGGNRSVHFTSAAEINRPEVQVMIAEALTYHRNKRR